MKPEQGTRTTPGGAAGRTAGARATAQTRTSEIRYRRLFETAQDGIFLLDAASGKISDVNPYLMEMLGYSRDELVGKSLWEIGPAGDAVASRRAMQRLQDEEYIRYEDLPLETKTKKRIDVEFVSNVYVEDGMRVIQCNVREITARRRVQERMRKLNRELRDLVAEFEQRDRDIERIHRMSSLLQAAATSAEAHSVVARAAGDVFPGYAGFLALLDPLAQTLEPVAVWGQPAADVTEFPLADCLAMAPGISGEQVSAAGTPACRHLGGRDPVGGSFCIPLSVQGVTLGLLSIAGSGTAVPRRLANRRIVEAMAETIGIALAERRLHDELREQATRDVLTGLHNRRHLDDSLERELHRARRRKSSLCAAMLDLDDFKKFNDEYGHEAGDVLLREVGRVLRDGVRRSDIACRYGGEEFALVFPDASLADTRHRVEQIRRDVAKIVVPHLGRSIGGVTASAGIAQAGPDCTDPAELLRAADEALYGAKRAGRDRVEERAPPGEPVPPEVP